MHKVGLRGVRALLVTLVATLALSGCTIPFVNIEVPLPDPSSIGPLKLPFGVNTSVEEARQKMLSDGAKVDDSALVKPGYLTVGLKTATSSAPTCALDEEGEILGLDVDLGAVLASELGLKVRYVSAEDDSKLGKECDVLMNHESKDESKVKIAGNYVESAIAFFRKGEPTVVAVTDLGGKSVGLQGSSVSETALNKTGLKMSQKSYENLNEAFKGLESGEVDYVLCEAYPGAYLASLRNGIAFAGCLEQPKTSGVAVLASNAALADPLKAAFEVVSANGQLQGVRERWVGSLPVLTNDSQIKNIPEGEKSEDDEEDEGEDADEKKGTTETVDDEGGPNAGSNAITSVPGA